METKSGSKSGSKSNLNESSLPLLEEETKDVPEKIELTEKDKEEDKKDQNESKKGKFRVCN
jgi:hypothetical protein